MKIKLFLIIILLLGSFNLKANIDNLDKKYIPLKDFIVLKFDLFFQKNLTSIFHGGGITGIAYQNIDYNFRFDTKNNFIISLEALMDKKRYKSKKYYPKIKDCTQIRNKLFTNKYGYSFFSQKLNNLVNENKISDSINQNILNITNLSEDQKKELLNKTQIKISIIHPDNEKSILCRGKITDIELKNM